MSSDPRPKRPPAPRDKPADAGHTIGLGSGGSSGALPAPKPAGETPPQAADKTPGRQPARPPLGPAPAPLPKTIGRFKVVRLLGWGGMGMVMEAKDETLNRSVAVKVMLPRYAHDPVHRERFLREAQAQARVEHKYIVPIYEFHVDTDPPYLVMPLLHGQSLDQRLKEWVGERRRQNKRLGLRLTEAFQIAAKLATALDAVHKSGMVHRDIKPSNVWLEGERARLLDFGVVRRVDTISNLTQQGDTPGTPNYMAPEQTVGDPTVCPVDHRADLFSLGVVMYEMFTGVQPFPGHNLPQIILAHRDNKLVPVRAHDPRVPEALADLIHSLLAVEPNDRKPDTAGKVLARLLAIQKELQVSPGLSTSLPRPTVPVPEPAPPAFVPLPSPDAIEHIVPTGIRITDRPVARRRGLGWVWTVLFFAAVGLVVLGTVVGVLWAIANNTPATTP